MSDALIPDPTITHTYGGERGMENQFVSDTTGNPVTPLTLWANYLYYREMAVKQAETIAALYETAAHSWPLRTEETR
jgi:hypothetical protein